MPSTKSAFTSLIVLSFICVISVPLKAQQKTVTIQPQKPAPGDTVAITYHPDSPYAEIKSPDSLKLVFRFVLDISQPHTFAMRETSDGWTANVPLPEHFSYDCYYFKSGRKKDKNTTGHLYDLFAYEKSRPVKDAYLRKGLTIKRVYPKASQNTLADMQARFLKKELDFYPHNYHAQIILYSKQLHDIRLSTLPQHAILLRKAHKCINRKLAEDSTSWKVVYAVKYGYRLIGEKARGDSLQKAIIKKYPHSDVAMYQLYHKAIGQKDRDKKMQMLKKYVDADYKHSYMNKYYTWRACADLFLYYAKKDSIEQLHHIAKLWLHPNPRIINNPRLANDYLAAAIFLTKNTPHYDWAEQIAHRALQLSKKEPVAETYGYMMTRYGYKLRYLPENKAKGKRKYRKANILAILGLIYTKKGNYNKAETTLKKALQLADKNVDARKYLANLYMQSGHPQKASEIYKTLMNE